MATAREDRPGILARIDTKTKVLALVTLVLEGTFLASVAALPKEQILLALVVVAVVFVVVVVGIFVVERAEIERGSARETVVGSPLTPDSPMLRSIVEGAIHTVCRGVTVPLSPEDAKLRAFIFKVERTALVCTHFWAPQNLKVKEKVGLAIPLTPHNQEYVVVRSYYHNGPARTPVKPLQHKTKGVSGEIDDSLQYVLAAPIRNRDGSIYGIVDFDTSNERGRDLLSSEISDNVMHHLAEHLRVLISLSEPRH